MKINNILATAFLAISIGVLGWSIKAGVDNCAQIAQHAQVDQLDDIVKADLGQLYIDEDRDSNASWYQNARVVTIYVANMLNNACE